MFQVTFSEKHLHLGKKQISREENIKLNQWCSKDLSHPFPVYDLVPSSGENTH